MSYYRLKSLGNRLHPDRFRKLKQRTKRHITVGKMPVAS